MEKDKTDLRVVIFLRGDQNKDVYATISQKDLDLLLGSEKPIILKDANIFKPDCENGECTYEKNYNLNGLGGVVQICKADGSDLLYKRPEKKYESEKKF